MRISDWSSDVCSSDLTRDKARIIRIVKFCEILIMLVGGIGLVLAWMGFAVHLIAIPLMMLALFAMGVHSTFFGPINYAILPQHLKSDEVLEGTGLVEAGRPEERRVGEECDRTGRSRWWPYH